MADACSPIYDVVVIGGGVAGLAAASRFQDRNLLVLEASDRLGGRLHSIPRPDGAWVNLGAHLLTGGDSRIAELVRASGLESMPVRGLKSALWFGDRLRRNARVESYPFVLPLCVRERWALIRVGLRIRLLAEQWRRTARRRPEESWPDYRRRLAAFESSRTFAVLLEKTPERVDSIFRTAARRSSGEADEITAGAAVSIFGALWVGAASDAVTNVCGGSGQIGERWQELLADQVALEADVTEVIENADDVTVVFRSAGRRREISARQVIVTTPAPTAETMITSAPPAVCCALRGVAYGPFVCVSVCTDDVGTTPWDDVYAVSTPGLSFDMLFHHSNSMRDVSGKVPGRKSLMCYAGGDHGRAWAQMADDDIRRSFVADIERVFPHVRGSVSEVIVTRWLHGNSFATPGCDLAPVVAWNARAGARVRVAGDYFGALGGTADAAAASGYAAAAAALADLDSARSALNASSRHA